MKHDYESCCNCDCTSHQLRACGGCPMRKREPIPIPKQDTVDAERGAQALVLDVVFAICIALILWVVFTGADK
jgi:hypothetical protein